MCGDGGGYEGGGGGIVGHVGWIGSDVGMRSRMLLSHLLRFRICRRRDAIWGTRLPRFYRCPTSRVFKMSLFGAALQEHLYHNLCEPRESLLSFFWFEGLWEEHSSLRSSVLEVHGRMPIQMLKHILSADRFGTSRAKIASLFDSIQRSERLICVPNID